MEFYQKYKYPVWGAIIGLILAVLIMTLGFFKTLLILVLMVLGAFVGVYLQKTGILTQIIDRFKK